MGRYMLTCLTASQLLLAGVQLPSKCTKSKSNFYLLSDKNYDKTVFKFLDATLSVKHIRPSPYFSPAHAKALEKVNPRNDTTEVVLKTFTFGSGSKSTSIHNSVLQHHQKDC
jgi:hypothetical protein